MSAPALAVPCPLCRGELVCPASVFGGPALAALVPVPCPACCPEHYRGRRVVARGPGGLETVLDGPERDG